MAALKKLLATVAIAAFTAWLVALVISPTEALPSSSCVVLPGEDPAEVCVTEPTPDPVPYCSGFRWYGECWTKREGNKFSKALRDHGVSPWGFKKRHPELAAVFGKNWPGTDWQALDRSFPKALRYASDRWGVSYSWLYACAASEGGTNPSYFAIGTHGDSGWFQFLPGTWAWMGRSAFQSRGAPPVAYRHIRSVVGQTYTAAWAFSRGLSYHWYGRGC